MNVQLLLEELYARPNGRWRLMQALFLVIGIGSLAYVGWIYLDEYVYELDESKAFDRARKQRTPPVARSDRILPQLA
jgi:hypothetical protein